MKLDIKFAKTTVPLQIWICPCTYKNYFTLFMVPFMAAIAHHHLLDELKSLRPLANNALVLLRATSGKYCSRQVVLCLVVDVALLIHGGFLFCCFGLFDSLHDCQLSASRQYPLIQQSVQKREVEVWKILHALWKLQISQRGGQAVECIVAKKSQTSQRCVEVAERIAANRR